MKSNCPACGSDGLIPYEHRGGSSQPKAKAPTTDPKRPLTAEEKREKRRRKQARKQDAKAAGEERQPDVCFNGIPKDQHICVAECAMGGLMCTNCRLVQDAGTYIRRNA